MVSTIYQRFTYWFAPLFITVFVLSYQNCSDVAFQRVGGADIAPTGQACLPTDFNLQLSVPVVTLDTPVTFSANPPAANTTYTWDLNGVEVGQGPSMVRTFTQGGSFAMRVTAMMDDCVNPRSKTVNFFIDGGVNCDLTSLALSGDSNGMVAEVLDYAVNTTCEDLTFGWNAGDGTTITNTSNTMDHAWMWPGIFVVSTDVISSSAQKRLSMPVSIQQACPTLESLFVSAPDVAFVNDSVPFELVIPGCLNVLSMDWSFGSNSNPATASGRAVQTAYSTAGVKNATVTVSTKEGSVELPHRITILNDTNPCDETLLTLTGPTVGNVGESLRYGVYVPTCMNATAFSWNFGDATSGSTNPINKIYNTAGEYRVSVIVTTTAHGFITLSRRVVIRDVITYSWVEAWGACSGPCGDNLGTQTSSYQCRDSNGQAVASTNCTNPEPASQVRNCTVPANTCTCTPPQVNVNGVCVIPTTTCNVLVGTNNIGTVNNGATVTRWRSNPGSGQCGTRCQSQTLTCTAPNNVVFDASYIHANQNACMIANPCADGLCKSPPHGSTLTSPPASGTANLCSAGTASGVTTGASTYNWTCAGSAGGLTDNCFANIGTVTCPTGYHLNASSQCVKWNYTPSGCSSNLCGQSGVTTYTSSCINTSGGAATGCNPSLNQPPQNVSCTPNPTSCVCPQGQVNQGGVCRTPVNGACLNPNPRVITSSQALPNPLCQAGDANPASFTVPVGGTTTYSCVGQYTGSTAQNCRITRCLSGYSVINDVCVQNVTYSWQLGAYGTCVGACGANQGTQTAQYQCVSSNGQVVADSNCSGTRPASQTRACTVPANSCTCTPPQVNQGGVCVTPTTYGWVLGSYDVCSGSCGTNQGTQTAVYQCRDNNGTVVSNNYCTTTRPASVTRACTASASSCTCASPRSNQNGSCVCPAGTTDSNGSCVALGYSGTYCDRSDGNVKQFWDLWDGSEANNRDNPSSPFPHAGYSNPVSSILGSASGNWGATSSGYTRSTGQRCNLSSNPSVRNDCNYSTNRHNYNTGLTQVSSVTLLPPSAQQCDCQPGQIGPQTQTGCVCPFTNNGACVAQCPTNSPPDANNVCQPNGVAGLCGSANTSTPTRTLGSQLCAVGAATTPVYPQPGPINYSYSWSWQCGGTNGAATAYCGAPRIVDALSCKTNVLPPSGMAPSLAQNYCNYSADLPFYFTTVSSTQQCNSLGLNCTTRLTWTCPGINGGTSINSCSQ